MGFLREILHFLHRDEGKLRYRMLGQRGEGLDRGYWYILPYTVCPWYDPVMHRRLDILIYIVSAVFLIGALSIWWQGVRPPGASGDLEVLGPVPGTEVPPQGEPEPPEEPATVVVHVGGAVKSPGVYRLKEGQRVYEAVALAEPEEDADLDLLNLAAVLNDSQRIIVPRKGEALRPGNDPPPVPGGGYGAGSGSSGSGTVTPSYPLNVNTASQKELETLPGIGPVLARAIIDYRERCGPFRKLEDLLNVSGVGEKILARISDYLVAQ
jgi:competence protein ComEA